MKKILTDGKDINDIIQKYQDGRSTYYLSKEYKCDRTVIRRVLIENNVLMRDQYGRCRKFSMDESFFDRIDSEEKSYWLGFLYADGCVKKNGNSYTVALQLSSKDREVISKFKKALKSDHKIATYIDKRNGKSYHGLYLGSYKLAMSLIKLGCGLRKTFTAEIPFDHIPDEMFVHFMRGYFDGDGCITCKHKKYKYASVQICVSYKFGFQLQEYLLKRYNIKSCLSPDRSIYTVSLSNQQALSFLRLIYENSNIHLDRKHRSYLLALERERERKKRRR